MIERVVCLCLFGISVKNVSLIVLWIKREKKGLLCFQWSGIEEAGPKMIGGNNNIVHYSQLYHWNSGENRSIEATCFDHSWSLRVFFLFVCLFSVTYLPTSVRFGHRSDKWHFSLALHSGCILFQLCAPQLERVCVAMFVWMAFSLTLTRFRSLWVNIVRFVWIWNFRTIRMNWNFIHTTDKQLILLLEVVTRNRVNPHKAQRTIYEWIYRIDSK